MACILCVEDELNLLNDISEEISDCGHTVLTAENGQDALRLIHSQKPDLVLCDISMPVMNGIDLLKAVRNSDDAIRATTFLFLSASTDSDNIIACKNAGADDFIPKPIDFDFLIATLNSHLARDQRKNDVEKNRLIKREAIIRDGMHEIEKVQGELGLTLFQAVESLMHAVEARDPYTAGHQKHVSLLSTEIAKEMGLSNSVICGISMAALIHDVGKVAVPIEYLTRTTPLTELQFELIKTHPEEGAKIIANIDFPWPVKEIVLQHHERLDGSGYPFGLKGNEIIKEAKIVAVADVIDAIECARPYRKSLGTEKAIDEISKNKDRFYDSDVVEAAIIVLNNRKCFEA